MRVYTFLAVASIACIGVLHVLNILSGKTALLLGCAALGWTALACRRR